MPRHVAIGILVWALLAASTASAQAAAEPDDPSYLNGYSAGRALAGYYEDDERQAEFVRGLLEGLEEAGDPSLDEDRARDARLAWFDTISGKDRASYAAGYLNGDAYQAPESLYSVRLFLQGLLDSLQNSGPAYIGKEQGSAIVTGYQRSQFYRMKRHVADTIKANERVGKAFLAANATQPGINRTDSGMQFRVVTEGEGASPGAEDTVVVAFVGQTIDGEVFYDSALHNGGKPSSIKVSQTLNGFQEALTRMSPGAEWEQFLPAVLAYGNAGWQGEVEPGETLIYRLKLIEVIPAD